MALNYFIILFIFGQIRKSYKICIPKLMKVVESRNAKFASNGDDQMAKDSINPYNESDNLINLIIDNLQDINNCITNTDLIISEIVIAALTQI